MIDIWTLVVAAAAFVLGFVSACFAVAWMAAVDIEAALRDD